MFPEFLHPLQDHGFGSARNGCIEEVRPKWEPNGLQDSQNAVFDGGIDQANAG